MKIYVGMEDVEYIIRRIEYVDICGYGGYEIHNT